MKKIKLIPVAGIYTALIIIIIFLSYKYEWGITPKSYIENTNFGFSAFASFIGGFILALIIFLMLRPRIIISPTIAERVDDNGKTYYTFKFINNSIFPAFDVKIEAYLCTEENATNNDDGVNTKLTSIILTRKEWMFVPKWWFTYNSRKAPHCVTVRTFHDNLPDEIRENSEYLIFRVTLKHAFSNLSSTYRAKYMSDGCIIKGKFKFGNSFTIQ